MVGVLRLHGHKQSEHSVYFCLIVAVAQTAAFNGAMPSKIGQSRVGCIEMAKKSVRCR